MSIAIIPVNTKSDHYNPGQICAFHSGMKGHPIEACFVLKNKIQKLIYTKAIQFKDLMLHTTNNPLLNHQVNMLNVDDDVDLENSIQFIENENSTKIGTI